MGNKYPHNSIWINNQYKRDNCSHKQHKKKMPSSIWRVSTLLVILVLALLANQCTKVFLKAIRVANHKPWDLWLLNINHLLIYCWMHPGLTIVHIMGDHILSTNHHNASCRKTPLFLCMYSIGTPEFVSRESTENGKKRNLQQEEA